MKQHNACVEPLRSDRAAAALNERFGSKAVITLRHGRPQTHAPIIRTCLLLRSTYFLASLTNPLPAKPTSHLASCNSTLAIATCSAVDLLNGYGS